VPVVNEITTRFSARDGITSTLAQAAGSVSRFTTTARARFNTFTAALRENNHAVDMLARNIASVSIGNLVSAAVSTSINLVRANINDAIAYASDLIETQNIVETAFKNNAGRIDDFAKRAQANFGLTELSAKKAAAGIGAVFSGMGVANEQLVRMSEGITALSGDLASFYNLSTDRSFEILTGAITGQAEGLKKLGIIMNEDTVNAYLLSQGVHKQLKDFNDTGKAIARYNYILAKTNLAQGDYAKPTASYAVSSRNLAAAIGELKGRLAEGLLPTLITLADKVTLIVRATTQWVIANKEVIAAKFETLVADVINFARGVIETIKVVWEWRNAIIGVFLAFKGGQFALSVMNALNLAMQVNIGTGGALVKVLGGVGKAGLIAGGVVAGLAAAVAGVVLLLKSIGDHNDKKRTAALNAAFDDAELERTGKTRAWRNWRGEVTTDIETAKEWETTHAPDYQPYIFNTKGEVVENKRVTSVALSRDAAEKVQKFGTTAPSAQQLMNYAKNRPASRNPLEEAAKGLTDSLLPAQFNKYLADLEAQTAEQHDYNAESLNLLTLLNENAEKTKENTSPKSQKTAIKYNRMGPMDFWQVVNLGAGA
jgi:hypothetical protein